MSWKCPDCGSPNNNTQTKCLVCGFCEVKALLLTFQSGKSIKINITTTIGCNTWKNYDDDAKFMDKQQFSLEQDSENNWHITPNSGSTNETILNNKAISSGNMLKEGDVFGVGRKDKNILKMPVTVSFSN